MMQFRVLGPLSIWDGERPVAIPTIMVRRLLALLLSSAGKPISADALTEQLWHSAPPRSARKTLQVHMHRLRRLFDDRAMVTYDIAGYTLQVAPHELDAAIFADLVRQAVEARQRGELETAHSLLDRAHKLWRGDAYAGYQDMELIAAEAERLQEVKLAALEEQSAISLELGRHAMLIGELSVMVANYPYRERLRGQLMLALYRGGRQAEALAVYRQGRDRLVADLGVEPMPELQMLQRRILANDPMLALPRAAEPSAHHYLPRDVPGFVGRDADLRWLDNAAANRDAAILINAIAGTAGVGKPIPRF